MPHHYFSKFSLKIIKYILFIEIIQVVIDLYYFFVYFIQQQQNTYTEYSVDMQLKRDKSISQHNSNHIQRNDKIQQQMDVLHNSFKQYKQQIIRLTNLYEHAKFKNQKLLKANLKLREDLSFLKDYCAIIESQLQKLGFQKSFNKEILSRKDTAQGILQTYDQSNISQQQTGLDQGYSQIQLCISKLQQQNRNLKSQLMSVHKKSVDKFVQANQFQGQSSNIWHKAYQSSQQKNRRLQWQIRQLKKLNDTLQMQKIKRGITNFIMEDRKQIFNNIHKIISDYKNKIKQLASQKKDAQKKYKNLKQKLAVKLQQHQQLKLLEIYTQKIDVLQKLTQKQQLQIQNTIELYQIQIKKIEERRLEEIHSYQNARLDLQTQNLKLHIDLQKSLNKKDDLSLELIQQKSIKENLIVKNRQIQKKLEQMLIKNSLLEQKMQKAIIKNKKMQYQLQQIKKQKERIQKRMSISSDSVKIMIEPEKKQQIQKALSHSSISGSNSYIKKKFIELQQKFQNKDKEQDMSGPNPLYSSHIFHKKQLQQYHLKLPKRQTSINKKITITYNPPLTINQHNIANPPRFNIITSPTISSSNLNLNKTHDSILQYKKKFIQRKPQSSFNH